MTRIAGLSAFGRGAAVLVDDGRPVVAAAEELFSRRKGDPALPKKAYEYCCATAGIDANDPEYVVFAEKPVQRFVRILGGLATGFPATMGAFPSTLTTWLGDRLWLRSALVNTLDVDPERLLFVERSVAQCASAFLTSPFEEAAVLVVDDVGEWAATTLAKGGAAGGKASLELLAEIPHPHSLSAFLGAVARHLLLPEVGGLRWLSALAAYGEPSRREAFEKIVLAEADGAYSLDPNYWSAASGTPRFARAARKLLGEPRSPRDPLLQGDRPDPRCADFARSAQRVVEDRCLALAAEAKRRTGATRLCLGGALFQDPKIAARVLAEAPFEEVHVDPYLDEAGAANGAALYVTHVVQGIARRGARADRWDWSGGRDGDPAGGPFPVERLSDDDLAAAAAGELAAGKVVAWSEGAPELGPRCLGRRALLVDPNDPAALRKLRTQVKLSESWVPLALAAPRSLVSGWGDPKGRDAAAGSRATVRPPADVAARVPGAVHVDGASLAAGIDAAELPRLARLLAAFASRTGRPPVLAMSSLNRAGDPPVLDLSDALEDLRRTPIDCLVWGSLLARAPGRPRVPQASPTP